MIAIFRGKILGAKINKDTSNSVTLELIVSIFLITRNGKIQVIKRNPIRFFTDDEKLINSADYKVGDLIKITVCKENDEFNVTEIKNYPEDEDCRKNSENHAISGIAVSFREILNTSQTYRPKTKKET